MKAARPARVTDEGRMYAASALRGKGPAAGGHAVAMVHPRGATPKQPGRR